MKGIQQSIDQQFDLSYLNQVFQGNKDMVDSIITLFLQQVPQYVSEIRNCMDANSISELHPLAHKAKSSIAMLGLKDMEQTILKIEHASKYNENTETLPDLVSTLEEQCEKTYPQLSAHLETV